MSCVTPSGKMARARALAAGSRDVTLHNETGWSRCGSATPFDAASSDEPAARQDIVRGRKGDGEQGLHGFTDRDAADEVAGCGQGARAPWWRAVCGGGQLRSTGGHSTECPYAGRWASAGLPVQSRRNSFSTWSRILGVVGEFAVRGGGETTAKRLAGRSGHRARASRIGVRGAAADRARAELG